MSVGDRIDADETIEVMKKAIESARGDKDSVGPAERLVSRFGNG